MVPKGLYVKVLREGVILPCMLNSSNLFSHIVVILNFFFKIKCSLDFKFLYNKMLPRFYMFTYFYFKY